MNSIVIYYSYGGNTHKSAERIQKILGADAAEIETVKPYSGNYIFSTRNRRLPLRRKSKAYGMPLRTGGCWNSSIFPQKEKQEGKSGRII